MGKRAHKRQKTEKAAPQAAQPLGSQAPSASLLDDASKDDEERRLESMLFGTAYVPASLNENILVVSDDEQDDQVEGTTEFQTMLDSDVRFSPTAGREMIEIYARVALLCGRRKRRSVGRNPRGGAHGSGGACGRART